MHRTADMSLWRGRVDAEEGLSGRRWHQVIAPLKAQSCGIGLIGFACDAGVARNLGRVGASKGPAAIRAMLANLPVRDGIEIVDAGDVTCPDIGDLEAAQSTHSGIVADILGRGLFPLTLGGGHEVAFGSWGGIASHIARTGTMPRIGIINLDAHFDLRLAEKASSGTPFRQIAEDCQKRGWPFRYCCLGVSEFANTAALFERAASLGVTWLRDEDMAPAHIPEVLQMVDGFMTDLDQIYLTVCLDVLPPGTAPGVSAPSARGVDLAVIEAVITRILDSGKLRIADIAEMNPSLDIDNHTARVAARLAARIAEGVWRKMAA